MQAAFGYFTIVPAGSLARPPDSDALAALPLAGAAVGAAAGLAGLVADRFAGPPFGALAAFAALLGLTGALHFDGFLDACDAAFASVPPERRLAILKDPAHGTYALAGAAIVVPLGLAGLARVSPARLPGTLAFAAALARLAAVMNAALPGAADGAVVNPAFAQRPPVAVLMLESLALALAALALRGPRGTLLVPAAVMSSLAGGAWLRRRFAGRLTGDAYGFLIVVLETATIVILGVRSRGGPL